MLIKPLKSSQRVTGASSGYHERGRSLVAFIGVANNAPVS